MSPALADFLFEAANFLILAAALGWILFKPVRRALDAERTRHGEEVAEAERLRKEAESLQGEARARQDALEHELSEKRREILAAARREASRIIDEAKKRGGAERQRLEAEMRAARETEIQALAEEVGRLAANAVRSLLEKLDGPSIDVALVRAACAELETLPAETRRSALVEVARPIDPEAMNLLERALGAAEGGGVELRIVSELGAGVRVTTPAGQVDATAVSIARRAAQAASSALRGENGTDKPRERRDG